MSDRYESYPQRDLGPPPGQDAEPFPPQRRPVGMGYLLFKAVQIGVVLAVVGWFVMQDRSGDKVPVSIYDLSAALPSTPPGWRPTDSGVSHPSSTTVMGRAHFTASRAWKTYRQGDREVTVDIWDWAGDYPYHMPWDLSAFGAGDEVRVDGNSGHVRYNPSSQKGRLRVRYADRFYLIVEGEGIRRGDLDSWYRSIDLGRLHRGLGNLRGRTSSR